jgi:hypothetical protein
VPTDRLRHEEGAFEVDAHDEVEIIFGDRLGSFATIDAGDVHQDVDSSEVGDDPIDEGLDLRRLFDIAGQADGAPL